MRPLILVDSRFWRSATSLQRQVVVAHEEGHRRGRQVLVDGAARALTAGLAPLPAAARAYQWVRRQLEALADDAAVRRHDGHTVGLELGRIALADHPRAGLGVSGAALWRVQRLLWPPSPPLRRAALLLPAVSALAAAAGIVLADTAQALGPVATARLCPV